MLEVDRQSGGFTPSAQLNVFNFLFNRGGMPLTIPMGPTPWNLYPACPIDTNGHIEIECFNSLKPDGTIPLGICNSNRRFFQKAPPAQCSWSFFMSV